MSTWWNLKIHQLHEFVIYTSSQSGNERWRLMSKLVQFTDVHFLDLNPNSYDNLTWKSEILISPQGQSRLVQITRAFSFSLQIRVISSFFQVFCSVCFKGQLPVHLQKWNLLHVSLAIYLLYFDSSHIFKILPNVRSTINGKKANTDL